MIFLQITSSFGMIECKQFVTGTLGLYLQKPGVGLNHPFGPLLTQELIGFQGYILHQFK